MANLPESAKWETGIYQLEEDDFVLGGVDGVDNKPLKQLANRTLYLKNEQEKLKTATAAATTAKTGTTMLSNSTTGTSETKAATESAVKALNDTKANLASPTFTGAPKAPTPANTSNDTTIATTAFVKALIAALIGGAPAQLDTLKEIATALGNNANLSATLLAEIAKKSNTADVVLKTMFIGVPIPYPSATVPDGFVAMTGKPISKSIYPRLYALYGSNLPDMRAEFIRGWDNGRNVDKGRAILTAQGDAIRNIVGHLHTNSGWIFNQPSGAFYDSLNGTQSIMSNNIITRTESTTLNFGWIDFDASRSAGVQVASENRSRNVAFNYICLAG